MRARPSQRNRKTGSGLSGLVWRAVGIGAVIILAGLALAIIALAVLRFVNPLITMIRVQRRIEAVFRRQAYHPMHQSVPLEQISPHLQHAVIAAEDGRFYEHRGIDWKQVQIVVDEAREAGELEPSRGASTITQQLIKNLFFTT